MSLSKVSTTISAFYRYFSKIAQISSSKVSSYCHELSVSGCVYDYGSRLKNFPFEEKMQAIEARSSWTEWTYKVRKEGYIQYKNINV